MTLAAFSFALGHLANSWAVFAVALVWSMVLCAVLDRKLVALEIVAAPARRGAADR
jgi:hypothetical protein